MPMEEDGARRTAEEEADRPAADAAAHGGHGAHARKRGPREAWGDFRGSPFFPAVVLVFILSAAAGLFAGSYTYSMANPTPHHIPTALVAPPGSVQAEKFVAGLDKALNTSLALHPYEDERAARQAMEEQTVFAIVDVRPDGVHMDVAGAAGASVAQVLTQAAPPVAKAIGVPVTITDVKPLQRGDPRGLALFYISLAAVVLGFVGSIQLSVHARTLNPLERIAFTVAYSLLGGFTIAAVVDWGLGAVRLPFIESWMILALTMFTSGMVFTMFNTLIGRWAMLPTWGLMVLLGNPSSGGAVSWPLLPSLLGHVGRWLPPGASVNAQHTAVYFADAQHAFPFLVLAAWSLLSCAVFWFWRHRHPGGRDRGAPAHGVAVGA
ncbi:ABC transporter permease [Streptomyces sp. NBC_00083]|uniref:ABC transporter permease n=1 Tax=Streptomyces sp. NBC_00083 TaxID=2975647 RepID=UPI00224E9FE9|nr:ABC transporter permease [Streptomyces sp. NBC_00083]MCX5384428.1 ABC transporter permease [Streptomyces sp. NBC_00083]